MNNWTGVYKLLLLARQYVLLPKAHDRNSDIGYGQSFNVKPPHLQGQVVQVSY